MVHLWRTLPEVRKQRRQREDGCSSYLVPAIPSSQYLLSTCLTEEVVNYLCMLTILQFKCSLKQRHTGVTQAVRCHMEWGVYLCLSVVFKEHELKNTLTSRHCRNEEHKDLSPNNKERVLSGRKRNNK